MLTIYDQHRIGQRAHDAEAGQGRPDATDQQRLWRIAHDDEPADERTVAQ